MADPGTESSANKPEPSNNDGSHGVFESFERLVEEHYRPAYRFAFSLSGNRSDACDIAQQAFYLAQTKSHQLRDPAKRKQWLFTMASKNAERSAQAVGLRPRLPGSRLETLGPFSEFCDEPVDQTSRNPQLGARRSHKFLGDFRLIGQGTNHRLTHQRECPMLVGGGLPLGIGGHKVKAELRPRK